MAVDPNVYALSISLQLESSDAFSTLEEFSQAAANVEERVSTAAKNSINAISGLIDSLNQQLSQAVITTGQFANVATDVESKLTSVASSLKDSYDTEQESLKDLEERLEYIEDIEDLQSKIEKSLEKEQKIGEEYLGTIGRLVKTLEGKNLIHDKEGEMIKAEQSLVEGMGNKWEKVKTKQIDSGDILKQIKITMGSILTLLEQFDKETEKFVTANYRVYGSQQKLVNNTRQLSVEFGIFREEALATYKALADVKTPREELYKLSATVGRANRVTGVGIDQIAGYTRELRGAGFDASRTRKQIDMLSAAQRAFGLSTYDMQKALEANNLSMEEQIVYFGKDAPEAFMKAGLGLRGVAKELGVNQKAADDWLKTLQLTGVKAAIFWEGFAGISADATITEKFEAMSSAAAGFVNELGITERQMLGLEKVTGDDAVALSKLTEKFGITTDQLYMMARAEANLTDEQKRQFLTMAGLEETFRNQLDADKRWRESMATLTAQLNRLRSAITGIVGWLVQMVADALIPVLYVLNFVIQVVGVFIGMIRSTIGWMEEWIPGFGLLMKAIRFVGGLLIGLVIILVSAGVALASFAFAFGSVSKAVLGSLNIIKGVGKAIIAIAQAIGTSIEVVLTGLGNGLRALGSSVKSVIIPLMQLSLAVLLVGAGFWLMGMGLKAAAEHGWAAFGMLVAMSAAMLTFIIVFAIIATVAAPAIPLIVALAAAVLILGAAALLAGLGMYFVGLSIESIAIYGLMAAAALPALAWGITMLALAGIAGFAGLMMLAGALWLLVVPLVVISVAMQNVSNALGMLSPEAMKAFGEGVRDLAWNMLQASVMLIPVVAIIIGVSIAMAIAAPALLVAATVFMIGAVLVGAGAWILGIGLKSLGEGAKALQGVDLVSIAGQLAIGGIYLSFAALSFFIGASLVGIGAILLGYGLSALGKGAKELVGVDFAAMSAHLAAGGVFLMFAAITFTISAAAVGVGALLLGHGLSALGKGAQELEGVDFAKIAYQLAAGGIYLTLAGLTFVAGATIVGIGAFILGKGLASLGKGAQELKDIKLEEIARDLAKGGILLLQSVGPLSYATGAFAFIGIAFAFAGGRIASAGKSLAKGATDIKTAADDLDQSGQKLLSAGNAMMVSAPRIQHGSIGLQIGANLLLPAASILRKAAIWLRPASMDIYRGMTWLESATKRFKSSVTDIEQMGRGMHLFAASFEVLSKAPIDSIGDAAGAALDAIPNVNKLARELDKSAGLFQSAADKFVKPVREISASLEELGGALANIGSQGLMVQGDMDRLGSMLEKYTSLLEGTAQRIELAVVSKAQPAMATAREEGLEDAVRSETITTVQVMDKTEGDAGILDQHTILLSEMVTNLRGINEKMTVMGDGGTELGTIIELLETYLPEMTTKDQGLTSEFNQWMK
jgi:hypothetical protein